MDMEKLSRLICRRMNNSTCSISDQKKAAERAEREAADAEHVYSQLELTNEQEAVISGYIDAIEKSEMEYTILVYQQAVADTVRFLDASGCIAAGKEIWNYIETDENRIRPVQKADP